MHTKVPANCHVRKEVSLQVCVLVHYKNKTLPTTGQARVLQYFWHFLQFHVHGNRFQNIAVWTRNNFKTAVPLSTSSSLKTSL